MANTNDNSTVSTNKHDETPVKKITRRVGEKPKSVKAVPIAKVSDTNTVASLKEVAGF